MPEQTRIEVRMVTYHLETRDIHTFSAPHFPIRLELLMVFAPLAHQTKALHSRARSSAKRQIRSHVPKSLGNPSIQFFGG